VWRYVRADAIAIVAAVVAVMVVGVLLLSGPARVGHLTVENPTDYDMTIRLASSPSGAWLPFAAVGQRSTHDFQDVVDQGGTWVFHFLAQGRDAGDLTITRADLKAAGWHVTVPDTVAHQLQQLGAPTSPCVSTDCQARGS
jgi:hypothetical protein